MTVLLMTVLCALLVFLLILLGVGFYFIRFMTKPVRQTAEHIMQIDGGGGVWKDLTGIRNENFEVTTPDDYILHGSLLYAEGDPDLTKWVIITHGYTNCRLGSYKYAHMFLKLGWNCCIWDLRHHGENAEYYCSMGYHEPHDIVTIAGFLRHRFGSGIRIGLHGESLGSASSILALGLSDSFAFLISDCGFASLKGLMCYLAGARYHLPVVFAWAASTLNALVHGYTFFSIEPFRALDHTTTPVLFIHGSADTFIPPSNAQKLYNVLQSRPHAPATELYLCPGAEHALSYATDPAAYERRVGEFLERIQ